VSTQVSWMLEDVAFANNSTGYAVGRGGFLRTTDGGQTWTESNTGSYNAVACDAGRVLFGWQGGVQVSTDQGQTRTRTLTSAWSLSDVDIAGSLCFAVGEDGAIYRSRDSGDSWDPLYDAGDYGIERVEVVSPTTAFACGDGGAIYRTTDGGDNWSLLDPGVTDNFRGLAFLSSTTGFVGGREASTDYATAYRTTDGGNTWNPIPMTGNRSQIVDISPFSPGALVVLSGNRQMMRTSNAGASWTDLIEAQTYSALEAVSLVGSHTIIASDTRSILRSDDRGQTWTSHPVGNSTINGVKFYDSQIGVALGHPGQVWFTDDGGLTWENRGTGPNTLYDAHFFSATEIMVVGAGNDDVIYTANSGASWQSRPSPNTGNLLSVDFVDDQRGVASGHNHNVSVTTNRGVSWTAASLPTSIIYLNDCAWRGDVILAAGRGTASVIVRSANNGSTWTNTTGPYGYDIQAVAFRTDTEVFIAADEKIYRSTDAGVTWAEETGASTLGYDVEDIEFFDDGMGLFVGSRGMVLAR